MARRKKPTEAAQPEATAPADEPQSGEAEPTWANCKACGRSFMMDPNAPSAYCPNCRDPTYAGETETEADIEAVDDELRAEKYDASQAN